MKKIILVVLLILNLNTAHADFLEVQEVYVNYKAFTGETRTPYLQVPGLEGHSLQNEVNLNINMDLWDCFYYNNTIHSLNDGSYRLIGLNWKFGVHITDYVDFGFNHFSEHYADFQSPFGFPLQNSWEFNFFFYRKHPGKGLF